MNPQFLMPAWPAPAMVRAACTLRGGGVSRAPYESLNLGEHVGDEQEAVADNRASVRRSLQLPSEPLWLSQVHGSHVIVAERIDGPSTDAPRGDAAITSQPGRVLAVMVADCLPVLLCRRDGAGVAVAHAGWRGLVAGVLEATVAAFGVPGEQLLAWLGPAIGQEHFEVGDEVRSAFCDRDAGAASAFLMNSRRRWQCDLHALARQRLQRAGVTSIDAAARCTYADAESFYSHRRDGVCGRFAALIWIASARAS